jgi:hypothetical protein
MRLPDRVNTDYLTLAALELAAVPLAVLVTVVVLFLGGGAIQLTESLGSSLDAGTLDLLVQLIALVTVLALFAGAAAGVTGYWRFFDRSERGLDPRVLVAIPLVGVVAPFAYAAGSLGTLTLPDWLFVVAVVSAHALAYRTIAVYSFRDGDRRSGLAVSVAAGLPVTLALVTFVTQDVLDSGVDAAGQQLLGVLTWTDLPFHRPLLVGLPVVVTGAYLGYRLATDDDRTDSGDSVLSFQRPQTPGRLFSITSILQNLSRSSSSAENASGGSSGEQSRYRRKSDSKGRPAASRSGSNSGDDGRRPKRRRSPHRSDRSKAKRRSRRSSSSGSTGRSRSSGASGSSSSNQSTGGSGSGSSSSKRSGASTDNRSRSASSGNNSTSQSDESASANSADSTGSEAAANGGTDASAGSDTRIFTDDFGDYGDGSDTVETCPACDEEIPSDGVYEFCPFCGQEL